MLARIMRFIGRKWDSFLFLFKSPASLKVDVLNPSKIQIDRSSRIGYFGRLYVNSPQGEGGIRIAPRVWTGRNIELQTWGPQTISIGRATTIQDLCKIQGDVSIGAFTTIASNLTATSVTHQFACEPATLIKIQDKLHPSESHPIEIGEDVWIGANVLIRQGVRIGRGSVIGANSVVTKDIEPYAVYAGAPAKKIKNRLDYSVPASVTASAASERIYFDWGFDHENPSSRGLRFIDDVARVALDTSAGSKIKIEFDADSACAIAIEGKNFALKPGIQSIEIPVNASDAKRSCVNFSLSRGLTPVWVRSLRVI